MTSDAVVSAQFREALAGAYLHACEVELRALKPGNVGIGAPGHAMCAEDFMTSAAVSVSALVAPDLGLGERIYRAVAATREKVACNTNLGIVLLCAPLLHALLIPLSERDLRARLRCVLRSGAGVEDTQWLYHAIRLAAPGGLGRSCTHDVKDTPHVAVVTAMQAAAHRDRIALQYVTAYADVFDYAVPLLWQYRGRWNSDTWAAAAVFLSLLRRFPDSHIARKYGVARARDVSRIAAVLEAELSQASQPEEITQRLKEVDVEFKSAGINPGTTADLTVASLLVYYLERLLSTDGKDLPLSMLQGDRCPDRKGAQALGSNAYAAQASTGPYRVSTKTLGVSKNGSYR
ncbi:MAG TPA: triphosphoribosyl-dephospho-CoA synthase [Gammaproteobacteria bacterium]|nr:triphosphoribosyl-dephospho-CoA synthase [Gammaproteobacteria bacterium]